MTALPISYAWGASGFDADYDLQTARRAGDLRFERRHVWDVVARLTSTNGEGEAAFESWHGEAQVFADEGSDRLPRGMRGFWRTGITTRPADPEASQSAGAPVLTYSLYNDAAYEHIHQNRLYEASEFTRLRDGGRTDRTADFKRTVPAFPRAAIVLKTVWWPVAPVGITALPVWDPAANPPRQEGNGYLTWRRVVAIDPSGGSRADTVVPVEFAGRSFASARRIGLERFYHLTVDARMAARLMQDSDSKKAAEIALGRPIRGGDYLILVAGNMATKEISDWIWAAFWWHDMPGSGPFAADRPETVRREWRNYLLQVAFDSEKPMAPDGGPHICFNPWLEARFPDAGRGGGVVSNCMACHRRASYPAVRFLPITRGAPDIGSDPAFAAGRLGSGFLWSLAMHARP